MATDVPHRYATRVPAESLGKPSLWVIINAPWYKDRTNAQARDLPPMPPLHAVEMNNVGAFSPTSCHRLTDSLDVSYHRLLLVLSTVGLRQRLGPHVRRRNDGNTGVGPIQYLRFPKLLIDSDTGSKGS